MKKIFISQPMKDKTDDEIKAEREKAIKLCKKYLGEDIEVIDSFIENAPADATPLWYLGESIKLLSQADYAFFCDGWEEARGCVIEHDCARKYDVHII